MKLTTKILLTVAMFIGITLNAYATTTNLSYGYTQLIVYPTGGSFTDIYNIDLTSLSSIVYDVKELQESVGTPPVNIYSFQDGPTGFSYGLYNASNVEIFDSNALAAGNYYLKISGITTGVFGGKYSINVNIGAPISPVPESSTEMLMIFGLLAVGSITYRKKIIH